MITSQETGPYLKFIFHEDLYLVNESISEFNSPTINSPGPTSSKKPEEITVQKNFKLGIVAPQQEVDKYKEFLTKLIGAIKIQWEEVSIISTSQSSLANFENFLVFGLENQHLVQFHGDIIPNEPLLQGKQQFIFTFSLSEFENNNAKKGVLWGGLKKGFSV